MIKFKQKGDFGNLDKYFKKSIEITKIDNIALVAERTLAQLKEATPKDSGLTANSWDYSITNNKNSKTLTFYNTNIQNGAKIALLIEVGHATAGGSWVEGKHFIEPITRDAYNTILNDAWKELKRL